VPEPLRRPNLPENGDEDVVWADRIIGGLILVTVVPLWTQAGRFPELAGAFPRAILAVIAALAILLIVRSFVGPGLPTGDGRKQAKALVTPILVAVISVLSVIGMTVFGFFPAMIGLGGALFFVLAGERRLLYISAIIITVLFIYLVFAVLLGVPLSTDQLFG
jgi:hypothetical protein